MKSLIRRNGIPLINPRSQNISHAKDVLNILDQGYYTSPSNQTIDISSSLQFSIQNSILHQDPLPAQPNLPIIPTVEVVNEMAQTSAARLISQGKTNIVALNFASGINPGGGFLEGSKAQEEDLCRCSGLYYCLKNKPMFYNRNNLLNSPLYTDDIIYSPNVPFFRDADLNLLEEPFPLSIITSPAPCLRGEHNLEEEEIQSTIRGRIRKILQVTNFHGHKNIILGAWGCGAFRNDPEFVAQTFLEEIKKLSFEHICFSVWDTRENTPVFATFERILK